MKSWLIIVGILFVIAEAVLWIKNFILPLPVYILGGAFLAIASNYEKGIMAFIKPYLKMDQDVISQTASLIEDPNILQEATPATKVVESD
ncbi:hypothetical protein Xen7305DRAFT_00011240 [Xenococcus sp. PCC 7305]|uniref:hypothetical protein n=1 Tax=Xenococcus sp. PCC 7305 TaxID=102125 RepID=UPI0002ABE8A9|nr:hypothetical protein [Xenococcus sp. PCC 7305]ELS01420.1 hypothetical protein Xen7305DRAFT_00011240 [Xenococcus sp. PCC 7305]